MVRANTSATRSLWLALKDVNPVHGMRINKRSSLLAIAMILWLAWPTAAAVPTVSLGQSVLEVAVGQAASLPIAVIDIQDLYGVEIHLRFDPAVVQVVDANPATAGIQVAPGGFLAADFIAQNQADNQAGTIDYAVTQINPHEAKSGSGTLLTIQFQGFNAGKTSPLEATSATLTTRDGEVIPVTFTRGEIKVHGASTAGDVATPSPTSQSLPATATPQPQDGGAAPTATRAFTNTPVGNAQAGISAPAPTPTGAAVAPGPTQIVPPTMMPPTPQAQTPTVVASQPPPAVAPVATLSATVVATRSIIGVQPTTAAVETPFRSSATAVGSATPSLLAKASSGSDGKAILGSGVPEKSVADETAHSQAKQPATSGLLIGAGALLSLAGVAVAVIIWLTLRRRHA